MLCTLFPCSYLVNIGCVKPLCDLLAVEDSRIILITLEGLENILKIGEQRNAADNPYAMLVEEAEGEKNNIPHAFTLLSDNDGNLGSGMSPNFYIHVHCNLGILPTTGCTAAFNLVAAVVLLKRFRVFLK